MTSPPAQDFLKRRGLAEGLALVDDAHIATHRLYCDALALWRRCPMRTCKRQRRCLGEPIGCLLRALPSVPPSRRAQAQRSVIGGGPRHIPPATHMEWQLRHTALQTIVTWGLGKLSPPR
jgi:hypothetical protein